MRLATDNGRSATWTAGLAVVALVAASAFEPVHDGPYRLALSETLMTGLNEADVRAAIRTWAETVSRETGLVFDKNSLSISNNEQLAQHLRQGRLEVVVATAPEYLRLAPWIDISSVVVDEGYALGEEYLLLVHTDRPIVSIEQLQGRTLLLTDDRRSAMALPWLENLLAGARLPSAARWFGHVETRAKTPQAVLPVYFGQADACLVQRRAFAIVTEMNPEIGRKLRVLAASPKLIPEFLAFHRNCDPVRRARLTASVTAMHTTLQGQQALTLFGGKRLVEQRDPAALRAAVEILQSVEKRARARGEARP